MVLVLQWFCDGMGRFGLAACKAPKPGSAGHGSLLMQRLFCAPSLDKVAADRRGVKKVFLYYDTDFWTSFAVVLSTVDRQRSSVRYITEAGSHLR
jgi:hypothetical protein